MSLAINSKAQVSVTEAACGFSGGGICSFCERIPDGAAGHCSATVLTALRMTQGNSVSAKLTKNSSVSDT